MNKKQTMKWPLEHRHRWSAGALFAGACLVVLAAGQTQLPAELQENFPYYMQSPIQQQEPRSGAPLVQRSSLPSVPSQPSQPIAFDGAPKATTPTTTPNLAESAQQQPQPPQLPQQPAAQQPQVSAQSNQASCLYETRHFARFDQCLDRKPYPTIGLPAFKNDELLVQRSSLADKHGCSFVLTNGLFKHYQISRFNIDTDTKCLDDNKLVGLSMQFSNVTLYYLWQLRCLNHANQLLDDATLNGRTSSVELAGSSPISQAQHQHQHQHQTEPKLTRAHDDANSLCVGSSQSFGFSSLQVSQVEAQVELAMDIYKNWRITNISLAMLPSGSGGAGWPFKSDESEHFQHEQAAAAAARNLPAPTPAPAPPAAIRDFAFETLDGDELNWRYLNLYENWSRNRLHSNFLEQFKRFLWISLQRCLSESSEKLPVKLVELFGQQRYN